MSRFTRALFIAMENEGRKKQYHQYPKKRFSVYIEDLVENT